MYWPAIYGNPCNSLKLRRGLKEAFHHFNTVNVNINHNCCAYATNQIFLKIIGAFYMITYVTFSRLPSKDHTFHCCCCTSTVYIRLLYTVKAYVA